MNDYQVLSSIYRQYVAADGVTEAEVDLVDRLAHCYGINRDARILDAACGVGDVVVGLESKGYSRIDATDGSLSQLQHWPSDHGRPGQLCRWQELGTFLSATDPYDMIIILGHSLPHLDLAEIPSTLQALRSGLAPGGCFLFDIRPWFRSSEHGLVQRGKRIGEEEAILAVEIKERPYSLLRTINYANRRQVIDYRLVPADPADPEFAETLTYAAFDSSEARAMMQEAGFAKRSIDVHELGAWPYLVVAGSVEA